MMADKVAVLGAGTMGHGIAQVTAQAGFTTALFDPDPAALERGIAQARSGFDKAASRGKITAAEARESNARLSPVPTLEEAVSGATLVIEAGPEKLPLKIQILREVCRWAPEDAVLASNTSSLSVTELAAATGRSQQVLGLHFFNPPPVMKLVELIRAEQSAPETVARARAAAERMGKTVIEVRDSPGFASSRLGIALAMEAIRMLEEGVASAEDIDRAMKLGYAHPMGPLELTDLVGLDVRLAIAEYLERELGDRFHAPQLLRRLVRAGKLGRKSGEGFYKYPSQA
ncbi:MAG TPA: 3-hydroxyacyl-CoA dehydrogenase family protein [Myxococcales bacterium]|nr:3-hydroxyacyl-CoA dehydrogenase family protein [Myxococcales bacterium]